MSKLDYDKAVLKYDMEEKFRAKCRGAGINFSNTITPNPSTSVVSAYFNYEYHPALGQFFQITERKK